MLLRKILQIVKQKNKIGKLFLLLLLFTITLPVKAQCWREVFNGWNHTFAIKTDSTLWAWGYNKYGQLGKGDSLDTYVPMQISTSKDWNSISLGAEHSLGIKNDGTLWAWGSNHQGQLGDSNYTTSKVPIQIGTENDWAYICAGILHSLAIKTNGTLWSWGDNFYYQLGDGTRITSKVPKQVGVDANWKSISSKSIFVMGIKTDGTLWGWGNNSDGQVGLGDPSLPYNTSPVQVGTNNNWLKIVTGYDYSLALKTDSTLWCWGANNNGQLGLGEGVRAIAPMAFNNSQKWKSIVAGANCSFGIKSGGTMWAWGRNDEGFLGIGAPIFPTTIYVWLPMQIGTDSNWQFVSSKLTTSAAIAQGNLLLDWGQNTRGEVGNGTALNQNMPVQISCFITAPVQLISFTTAKQQNSILLNWVTAIEVNSKKYQIERSNNGIDFNILGSVISENRMGESRYQFTDMQPKKGWNYYRLKMVDKDGVFTYSGINAINFEIQTVSVELFPNPVNNLLYVKNTFVADNVIISLTDIIGRKLLSQTVPNNKTAEISTEGLKKGVYMVTVSANNNTVTKKIIKQ